MTKSHERLDIPDLSNLLLPDTSRKKTKPIYVVNAGTEIGDIPGLTAEQRNWLKETGFAASPGETALLPSEEGNVSGAIISLSTEDGPWPREMPIANLAKSLPEGNYHLEEEPGENAVLFWLLGAYRFEQYKSEQSEQKAILKPGKFSAGHDPVSVAQAVFLGRNLINTPAEDLGPEELEATIRALAKKHKAKVAVTVGDDLLKNNFPLVHAVGRASHRQPCVIDLTWGDKSAPSVTLVGKGICFDTGGLNLKPGMAMTLMKKDMGGAAAAIALAHMIMSAKLPVRLRLIIASADNNVSSNSFRPGDVFTSRGGLNVEISNTDAEGRLVLADALALADEDEPDYLFDFATLTGAARVALGPDVPPFYSTDDGLADMITQTGKAIGDPLWRLPLWEPYERMLKASTGDIDHCSDNPMGGSITAALFLKRFVKQAKHYAHFDIYGWTPSPLPAKPKGGEPQAARTVFAVLSKMFAASD